MIQPVLNIRTACAKALLVGETAFAADEQV
jgi:hypothetical protein